MPRLICLMAAFIALAAALVVGFFFASGRLILSSPSSPAPPRVMRSTITPSAAAPLALARSAAAWRWHLTARGWSTWRHETRSCPRARSARADRAHGPRRAVAVHLFARWPVNRLLLRRRRASECGGDGRSGRHTQPARSWARRELEPGRHDGSRNRRCEHGLLRIGRPVASPRSSRRLDQPPGELDHTWRSCCPAVRRCSSRSDDGGIEQAQVAVLDLRTRPRRCSARREPCAVCGAGVSLLRGDGNATGRGVRRRALEVMGRRSRCRNWYEADWGGGRDVAADGTLAYVPGGR